MIYDEDPFRRRPRKLVARNVTGEVCLDDGKYGQMAFRAQENRKIRSSDGCGENPVLSTMVGRYGFHEPGGNLGNVGQDRRGAGRSVAARGKFTAQHDAGPMIHRSSTADSDRVIDWSAPIEWSSMNVSA